MFLTISNFNKLTYDYFSMAIQIIFPNLFLAKYINLLNFNLFLDLGIPFYFHAARKYIIHSQLRSTTYIRHFTHALA